MKRLWLNLSCLLAGALVLNPGGAVAKPRVESGTPYSMVVLDFAMCPREVERRDECTRELKVTPKPVETEKDRRGWWFGAQDLYFNSNNGRIAADLFSEALDDSGLSGQYSREDLKYYYADKRDLLKQKLSISDRQMDHALATLDPQTIGREIGAQKVIVGRITDSEMRHNRVSGHFLSVASFSVAVIDVRTGHVDFEKDYRVGRNRSSQYSIYEDAAHDYAESLKKSTVTATAP